MTPALFVLFAGLLNNTILENPDDSLIGTAMIVLGIPAYFYWSKKKR